MLHGFEFALRVLKKRPLRTSLTLLQVAVGVAAITLVLSFVFSLLTGTKGPSQDRMLLVEYGQEIRTADSVSRTSAPVFTPKMVKYFEEESSYISGISIFERDMRKPLEFEGIKYIANEVLGVDANLGKIAELKIISGDFFSRADVVEKSEVLVISTEAEAQLFGKESAVGKTLRLTFWGDVKRDLKVIGVFSGEKQLRSGEVAHFLVPYSLFTPDSFNEDMIYGRILIFCKEGKMAEAKEELNMLFSHFHQDSQNAVPADLPASSVSEEMELIFREISDEQGANLEQVATTFGLFIGSFAFIALVVSFIGILSMMLVSIVERTREIGLRRALGASKLSVIGQVLSESVLISFTGGVLGIFIAGLTIEPVINELIIKNFLQNVNIQAHLSIYPVLIALASVVLVGLIAGLYPGIQVAKLSPVQAIKEG